MLKSKQLLIIYFFLFLTTLTAFIRVGNNEFVDYDDNVYITENRSIQNGITLQGLGRAFTMDRASNWHPLTWISHMLDVQFFGLNPQWHHLTNLLFHIANVLMLFFVLHRMTKLLWQSAFVAALFALHPLHVESVAWIAERKDVLSTFFWMLTLIAYRYYAERPRFKSYLAVVAFFALGLMAKPMVVTLPFVLLLLDYWPLERFAKNKPAQATRKEVISLDPPRKKKGKTGKRTPKISVEMKEPANDKFQWALMHPLVLEKVPLFALAALSCVITCIVQNKGGAIVPIAAYTPDIRLANAFISYLIYIAKMIWPDNLAVYYPHPGLAPFLQILGAILLLAAVTFAVIRAAKRFPYLPVGWLWFTGTLVPVIGLVQVGGQAMADRYTYIPSIGLFIMAAWGIPEFFKKRRYAKEVLAASSALFLLCLFILTWTQVGYWHDSITLFDHTLNVTRNNYSMYYNRGTIWDRLGNHTRAIEDFDRAIEIDPEYGAAYNNRGIAYKSMGNYLRAIQDFDRATEINPKNASVFINRGAAYMALGNPAQAIENYNRAIEIDPHDATARLNRGIFYQSIGKARQAIDDYDKAIENGNFDNADAFSNRGIAYGSLGDQMKAIEDFNRAIKINPRNAPAYNNLGGSYMALGNPAKAIEHYNKAVDIDPNYADAYFNRGIFYHSIEKYEQAIADYGKAIENNASNKADIFYNRGSAYNSIEDSTKAIEDYGIAISINPKHAKAYLNRGLTYGRLSNHVQAISDFDSAIEINPGDAGAYFNRGIAYGAQGNPAKAIDNYNIAIAINPEYPRAYFNRGMTYEILGKKSQAIEDIKTAARLGSEEARGFLRNEKMDW